MEFSAILEERREIANGVSSRDQQDNTTRWRVVRGTNHSRARRACENRSGTNHSRARRACENRSGTNHLLARRACENRRQSVSLCSTVGPPLNAVKDLNTSDQATSTSSGLSATFSLSQGEKGLRERPEIRCDKSFTALPAAPSAGADAGHRVPENAVKSCVSAMNPSRQSPGAPGDNSRSRRDA